MRNPVLVGLNHEAVVKESLITAADGKRHQLVPN